ncbi:MAG TPA: aldo/keto reductase [Candidatus Caenarcaniphilales bacterium]
MNLTKSSRLQFTPDLNICRVLNGMWQVSGAHGRINPHAAIQSMFQYLDAGFTTWDLADHYGPAEDFMGQFRRQLATARGDSALSSLQAFTKWVPRPTRMTKKLVQENINRSCQRMQVDTLDLLQFHWWEYRDKNYLDALKYLAELQDEGQIKHLALTNFDTHHLQEIVDNGIQIVANQVQFSVVDRRPTVQMSQFCQQHNIQLLAYGTLGGGLLSEKYLGRPEPRSGELGTASLRKYKNMMDLWGNWRLFQALLSSLNQVAVKHNVSISNVAVRYVLEQPAVAGVIVGARLGVSEHIAETIKVFSFTLDTADHDQINAVLQESQDLYQRIGDCGDEYRR